VDFQIYIFLKTEKMLWGFMKDSILVLGAILIFVFFSACHKRNYSVIGQKGATEMFNGIYLGGYKYGSCGTKYSETVLTY